MEMIKLLPAYKDYLWGGTRLIDDYNKHPVTDTLAESWEVSTHPAGQSLVEGSSLTLSEYLGQHPGYLGRDEMNLLIKFIDAAQALSIQVHPDEEYAEKNENEHGKNETWYVMDAAEGAFIYYGFGRHVTREEVRKAIEEKTILHLLRKVNVHKGDYFMINAGTLHAIGAGCLICEVQQNSDITYRLYDYDRRDRFGNLRELHVEKALDVLNYEPLPEKTDSVSNERRVMADCETFTTEYIPVPQYSCIETYDSSFTALMFLEGTGTVSFNGKETAFSKGDSFLVPAENGTIMITGACELIRAVAKQEV